MGCCSVPPCLFRVFRSITLSGYLSSCFLRDHLQFTMLRVPVREEGSCSDVRPHQSDQVTRELGGIYSDKNSDFPRRS